MISFNAMMRPAVVTPLDDHMGLDIARSLSIHEIPVYGLDPNRHVCGRYSKCCRFVECPDPETAGEQEYVDRLVSFARGLGQRPVLYPVSDRYVLVCSRNRERLGEHYEFVMPEHALVEKLTTKDGLWAIIERFKIPAPKTFTVAKSDGVGEIARRISYPAILKPTESTYWHDPKISRLLRRGFFGGRAKVIVCRDRRELDRSYRLIAPLDSRVIVQEVIPGEDDRLVYLAFYLDRQSRPLGLFAGRKCRIIPSGFGSASYVRSFYDPELHEKASRILSEIGYQGLGGLEFKKDPRDGVYKLIEFNTRFGMWDGLGGRCGVDLPLIAYLDALGSGPEPQLRYRENAIWIDWQRDLRASLSYWRKGQLTLGQWLRSLRGAKMTAIYSRDDWKPGAVFTLSLIAKIWNRLTAKNS
jgi:D-aspartate ligase